jgi:hypothetical protein
VEWLADAFPDLRPEMPCENRQFLEIAQMARRTIAEDPAFRKVQGFVPLLYTRRDSGDWKLFTGQWPEEHKAVERGRNPFRSTGQLIQQYRDFRGTAGLECVLVKVVANPPAATNPCDNPIITTVHLQQARDAGISAVLLDARHGVVDLVHEGEEFLASLIDWQREQFQASLRGALSLGGDLKRMRSNLTVSAAAAARYFGTKLAQIDDIKQSLTEEITSQASGEERGKDRFFDFRVIRQLRKDFRPFEKGGVSAGRRHDPAGDHLQPVKPKLDITKLSDRKLVREIDVALREVANALDRGALDGKINPHAALKRAESLDHDLTRAIVYANEWQRRAEARQRRAALSAPGRLSRLWGVISALRNRVTGSASAKSFFRAIERYAGLERTLEAAAEDLHAQYAAYPGRPDYPPVYRV